MDSQKPCFTSLAKRSLLPSDQLPVDTYVIGVFIPELMDTRRIALIQPVHRFRNHVADCIFIILPRRRRLNHSEAYNGRSSPNPVAKHEPVPPSGECERRYYSYERSRVSH